MNPNETQVGGSHYQQATGRQHWDIMDDFDVPYLEANATKYLSRWKLKGGLQDLHKAQHYMQKVASQVAANPERRRPLVPLGVAMTFCRNANLDDDTTQLIMLIFIWRKPEELIVINDQLDRLIRGKKVRGPRGFDVEQDVVG